MRWLKNKIVNYQLKCNRAQAPKTLDDALDHLHDKISSDDKLKIKHFKVDGSDAHFGLGMWVRNNWGLWAGGPLRDEMFKVGLYHADDMSSCILDAFVCDIRGEDFNIEEKAKWYKEWWKDKHGIDTDAEIKKLKAEEVVVQGWFARLRGRFKSAKLEW